MAWELTGNAIASTGGFLGTTDAQPLIVRTGTAPAAQPPERLRITPDGRIGIGTATPQARLSIAGGGAVINNVAIGTDTSGVGYLNEHETVGAALPGATLRLQSPNGLAFHAGPTGATLADNLRMTISPGGAVGVGKTPGAAYRLDVAGAINATDIHKGGVPLTGSQWAGVSGGISYAAGSVGIGTTSSWARLHVAGGDEPLIVSNNNHYFYVGANRGGGDYVDVGAYHATSGWKNLILNRGGGNVGIGTTVPQGKLDVWGDIRAGNSDVYFTKTDHHHSAIGNTAGWAAIENAVNYDALMILGRAGTPHGRAVKLWDYLQVNGRLDVTGGAAVSGVTVGTDAPGIDYPWEYETVGVTSPGYNLRLQSPNSVIFHTGDAPTEKMTIHENGDVTINGRLGTNGFSPTPRNPGWGGGFHTFDIEAEASIWTRNLDVDNAAGISRSANRIWFFKSPSIGSDARLKTKVARLSGVLERLGRVRGVSFERTGTQEPGAGSAPGKEIGVIAQEIEEAFPELVSEHGEENLKAVDYSGLAGVLIEAAKELKAEGEALRSRIEILERG